MMKKSKRFLSAALASAMVFGAVSVPALAEEAPAANAKITIDAESKSFEFSDGLYGTNHRFFSYGCGMWDHENQKVYEEFDELYANSGLHGIRYPGGTCSNYFWWKDSIGPVEERIGEVNSYRQNAGEVAEFGLHEFLDWAEKHSQKVTWVYNASNGNAQDAAELIYYLNGSTDSTNATEKYWADMRAANGHAEPYNVTTFELGNEFSFQSSAFSLGKGTGSYTGKSKDQMYASGSLMTFTNVPVGVYGDYSTAASKSTGEANQKMLITYGPAINSTIGVATGTATTGWFGATFTADGDVWTQVTEAEMAEAGAEDKVYWIEDNQYIHFGDGVHGAIPAEGKSVAATYTAWHDGVKQYCEEMKAAAAVTGTPIKVYSCLESASFIEAAKNTKYDGIAIHPYLLSGIGANAAPKGNWTTDLVGFHNNSALSFDISTGVVKMVQEELDANKGVYNMDRDTIVTEFTNHSSSGNYYGSMSNTVLTMSQLFDFFDMNLAFALRHSTIDDFFGGSTYAMALYDGGPVDIYAETQTGNFITEPSGYSYQILDHMTGDYHLDSTVENCPTLTLDPAAATSNGYNIPTDGVVDLVKPLASIDDEGNVYVIVLNKSADTNYDVDINVPGYTIGTADVEVLWNEDIAAVNTRENPDIVGVTKDTIEVNGESFTYSMPYCSMVGFKLTKGEAAPVEEDENPFKDVKEGDFFYDAVLALNKAGVIKGMNETTFAPLGKLNRAQVVTMLYRAAGCPDVTGMENPFKDVPANAFFTDAVIWCLNEGITTGTKPDTFVPAATCTREQLTTFLYRFMGGEAPEEDQLAGFVDAKNVSAFAVEPMNWAVQNGIMQGMEKPEGTCLMPKDVCVRAQAAVLLYRAISE